MEKGKKKIFKDLNYLYDEIFFKNSLDLFSFIS